MAKAEPEAIGKLPFTAVAAPDPSTSGSGLDPVPRDLDHYNSNSPPATRTEVYSYYAYYAANNGIGSFQ